MLTTFLMQSASCMFGGTLQQAWVSISLIVVLACMSIAGMLYAVANFTTYNFREKIKVLARFEIVQAFLSIIIIFAIIGLSVGACGISSNLSSSLIGTATDPFTFARFYVGNLLFNNGIGLMVQAWSQSINYAITGHAIFLLTNLASPLFGRLPGIETTATIGLVSITPGINPDLADLYLNLADFYVMLSGPVLITFSMLLLVWLALPVIQATGLTLLVPIALVMRMVSFGGPRVREISNSILAISLAFFFIYPMTMVFNAYAVGWLYCSNGISPCNPYTQYVGPYTVNNVQITSIFTSNTVNSGLDGLVSSSPGGGGGWQVPESAISGANFLFSSGFFSQVFSILDAPSGLNAYTTQVAEYAFQGIFLMALDLAVTVGFAIGLTKAFNAVNEIMGEGGSFWGGV